MDLPRILCGPILRRCDEQLVTVWLATSYELPADAGLVIGTGTERNEVTIPSQREKRTVRVGERLWVHLLLARPKSGKFPRGKLITYQIELGGREWLNVRSMELIYPKGPLKPNFFLPKDGAGIRMMHGSCRKPYGMGPDALAAADSLISRNPTNLEVRVDEVHERDKGRPAVLYMTGDQIYADDVQREHFAMIRDLSVAIMGGEESLPLHATGFQKLAELTFGKVRKDFTMDRVKFTTEDGEGHLLGLGEFCAMYLMVWGPGCWDTYAVDKLPSQPWNYDTMSGLDGRDKGALVRDMHRTMRAVRRALANVPTYMIFDDHDVTDDWNMNAEWYRNVSQSIPGRRVVANALAAYWLFQGWGNNPDHFDEKGFVSVIQAYCDHLRERKDADVYPGTEVAVAFVDLLWNYHDWHFAVPTMPFTLFADMRTERELYEKDVGPMLISLNALGKAVKVATDGGYASGSPLVIVSSAPVFNIAGLDMGQTLKKDMDWLVRVKLVDLDWEQWSNNPVKKAEFLRYLIEKLQPAYMVFLSGEVHFGLSAGVDYYLDTPMESVLRKKKVTYARNRCTRIIQLTSSPLKNENKDVAKWFVRQGTRQLIPGIDTNQTQWTILGSSEGPVTPKDLVRMADVKWIEIGENIRDNLGEAYAPVQGRSNLGVVTIEANSDRVVHEHCLLLKMRAFAPEILEAQTVIPAARKLTLDMSGL